MHGEFGFRKLKKSLCLEAIGVFVKHQLGYIMYIQVQVVFPSDNQWASEIIMLYNILGRRIKRYSFVGFGEMILTGFYFFYI